MTTAQDVAAELAALNGYRVTPATITLTSIDPDPDSLLFHVNVDGWLEQWTLTQIKAAVADGALLLAPKGA